uniref:Uncharacterized protein n=1 Tax=Timema tahoe TaxID=61484 RepID=A0A7R9FF43_9NEOP|nr:unnamed protein product [Timema tahoe]
MLETLKMSMWPSGGKSLPTLDLDYDVAKKTKIAARLFLLRGWLRAVSTSPETWVSRLVETLWFLTRAPGCQPRGLRFDFQPGDFSRKGNNSYGLQVMLDPSSHINNSETDHSTMNHGTMDHGAVDHGAMGHGMMDHGTMDHSTMDHGTMDHSTHASSNKDMDMCGMSHGMMMVN